VTYSGVKKIFVVYPTEPRAKTKSVDLAQAKRNGHTPKLNEIIETAMAIWKIGPEDLKHKGMSGFSTFRKAIEMVATEVKVSQRDIAKGLGISQAGVIFNLRHLNDRDKARAAELRSALGV
jgi:hypothetical protein